ncbi:MAG: histidine--tRNA ligase, partial [Anaerolineaceae bacterium]|nr:histidine--tRNA ligase [Anaerolineaceae bacterium]
MKSIIRSIKGTRDFYPEDMSLHSWLYGILKNLSEQYGYEEYDGPFLEKLELYAAKSGEELVKEQSFCFEDRGGDFITLRPELTPTLARMVAQKQNQLTFPLRWYSFGPFWRYERPQRGRTREFYQWNIDMIGVNSPDADAELVAICAAFFEQVGLSSDLVKIKVNNRRLMDEQLGKMEVAADLHPAVFKLIDRRPKLKTDAWEELAFEMGLNAAQLTSLKKLLDDQNLWKQSDELKRLFEMLNAMGYSEYVEYDPSIIRGLDYYTGTVFEAVEVNGGRAILGGGHYDNLVGDVGGQPLPGVGFAMGDVMIKIVLGDYHLLPALGSYQDTVIVTVFDDEHFPVSFKLAANLRREGFKVMVYPTADKLIKQFKYADRNGVRIALVLGPDELAQNQVTIKDLESREQEQVSV